MTDLVLLLRQKGSPTPPLLNVLDKQCGEHYESGLVPTQVGYSVLDVLEGVDVKVCGEHYERGLVDLVKHDSRTYVIGPPTSSRESIPLGRQHQLWKEIPRLRQELGIISSPERRVRVAAVGIVVDQATQTILLTRRSATLRSFPGCWVCPGGIAEPGETLEQAVVREVAEETGLRVAVVKGPPVASWESAMPLSPQQYAQARGLTSHVLMVAFEVHVVTIPSSSSSSNSSASSPPRLSLQPEECDSACWVSREELQLLLSNQEDDLNGELIAGVDKCQLAGIYPNKRSQGLGLGHHFVLSAWLCQSAMRL